MTQTSTIGFIQIEILHKAIFSIKRVSKGIEKMFKTSAVEVQNKHFDEIESKENSFLSFLLDELQKTYISLIPHSNTFDFETSFLDVNNQKKYLCHLTLQNSEIENTHHLDVTIINVSLQSKNIFILEEVLQRTSSVVGEEFFDSVVQLFHDFFGISIAYVGIFVDGNKKTYLHSLAKNGELSKGVFFDLPDSSCELVLNKGEVSIESGLDIVLPKTSLETTFKREAFLGQPIVDQNGNNVGVIGIQNSKKMQDIPLMRSILRILAPRTFAEFSRLSAQRIILNKNNYYKYILENISSNIVSTNSKGIIQNVTNSISTISGFSDTEMLGAFIGGIFCPTKDSTTQELFFQIISANRDHPIFATVISNTGISQHISINSKEFHFSNEEVEYIFIISESLLQVDSLEYSYSLEYFERESKILELRNTLIELNQLQTKDYALNINHCLQTVSKILKLEYSGYWELNSEGLKCKKYFELEGMQFNKELEGMQLDYKDYSDYIDNFKKSLKPIIISDVRTNELTSVFKDFFEQFNIHTMVEIPLWVNSQLVGMFCVAGTEKERVFKEYEISFITSVSVILSQNISQILNSSIEKELLSTQVQLNTIFYKSSFPMFISELETFIIVDVNESWVETFGFSKEDVIGKSTLDLGLLEPNTIEEKEQFLNHFFSKKEFIGFPSKRKVKNSDTNDFLITSTNFNVNNIDYAVFYLQNITDLNILKKEFDRKSQLIQKIFETSKEELIVLDLTNSIILEVNDEWVKANGANREEIVFNSVQEIANLVTGDMEEWQEFVDDVISNGVNTKRHIQNVYNIRLQKNRLTDCTGATFWWNNNLCLAVFGRDVSEQEKLSKDLEVSKVKAESAEKVKSEFLSMISHEIRTPISAILGFTNILFQELNSSTQRGYLEIIAKNSNTLLKLFNDILDLSKIETGKIVFVPTSVSLLSYSTELKNLFSIQCIEKNISLTIDIDELLPSIIRIDEFRLHQIITNLLINAIKFTDSGFISIVFSFLEISDSFVTISIDIQDSGIGISEAHLDSVFEPFQQVDSDISRKYSGTGLGLAIVKKLVSVMNGSITVSSIHGKGSVFSIILPDIEIQVTEINEDSPIESVTTAFQKIRLDGIVVLLINSLSTQISTYEMMLQDLGATIYISTSIEESLQLCEYIKFDCVLLFFDILSPIEIEYLNQIKQEHLNSTTPFVGISNRFDLVDSVTATIFYTIISRSTNVDQFLKIVTKIFAFDSFIEPASNSGAPFKELISFTNFPDSISEEDKSNFINEFYLQISPLLRLIEKNHQLSLYQELTNQLVALNTTYSLENLNVLIGELTVRKSNFDIIGLKKSFQDIKMLQANIFSI